MVMLTVVIVFEFGKTSTNPHGQEAIQVRPRGVPQEVRCGNVKTCREEWSGRRDEARTGWQSCGRQTH
jgi:hypothetical protein